MPDQRRLRRFGLTTAAISASTAALMLGGAAPADAAPAKCPVGHDPASTLKSIQCNLEQAGKQIQNQINNWAHPQHTTAPTPNGGQGKPDTTNPRTTPPQGGNSGNPTPPAPGVVPPGAVTPQSNNLQQGAPGAAQPSANLPLLAPDQPVVATGAQPDAGSAVPETHLISRVAAASDESPSPASPLIIAGISGVAGAVIALNASYAFRRMLRPPTRRR